MHCGSRNPGGGGGRSARWWRCSCAPARPRPGAAGRRDATWRWRRYAAACARCAHRRSATVRSVRTRFTRRVRWCRLDAGSALPFPTLPSSGARINSLVRAPSRQGPSPRWRKGRDELVGRLARAPFTPAHWIPVREARVLPASQYAGRRQG